MALYARLALLLALFLAFTFLSFAQGPLTLDELLEEARANNPELKSIKDRISAREAGAKAEGYLEDPTFKIELEDLSNDSPFSISPGNAMQTRYTLSQSFPFPGKLSLREEIAYKEALATRAELRSKELEITSLIKTAYFDFAFINESLEITKEIKDTLTLMSKVAETRYATGQVSQQDLIRAQVELTSLNNEVITLEAEREVAAARLKTLLNRPQDAPLELAGTLPKERASFNTGELIQTAILKNPDIRMLEFESEANELEVKLAKKNGYPDMMVGFAPIQKDGKFDSYDLMFQINIPIWREKYDSRTKAAKANASSTRSRIAAEKNVKSLEVKSAAVKVDGAERMRTLYETSLIPQVRLSFESALRNYQTGRIDFLMLLDAERELKRTRLEYLDTILEYRKMITELERAAGVSIAAVPIIKEEPLNPETR